MKINNKRIINCCLILFILCSTACSQHSKLANTDIKESKSLKTDIAEKTKQIQESAITTQIAKNEAISAPTDDTGFTSKKSYQEHLTKWLHPHKMDVQQGNVITSEMLEKLHIGMTKQQVKYLLGTSLLSESASKNQWLYVFSNATGGVINEEQSLVLSFNQDGMLEDIKEEKVVG